MSTPANSLFLVLAELRQHWRNFPVVHMLMFLEVAKNDLEQKKWGVLEIGERLDITQASVSRGLIDLSARTIPPGADEPIDLVTTEPDRFDHRKRIPVLTKKGRRVYDKIIRILERDET
ncbi:MarR family winged helix-turn-helix transcriptional regulator [Rhizobium sp. 18065]|uniref:MarR family winged helix-turn-helix transcriptional regulator n=1 Tax=Rhizobium sp. 18065 TaxID=2681411 RepID=UPI001359D977|nr:MarR family winged helix-turn-helix transcriptional regulator [Rhizobium sp. 18065]